MDGNVLEAAKQARLQLMPWVGWQPEDIEGFMFRYAEDTIIWGWYAQDEPLIAGTPREWQQGVYNTIKAGDPHNRPVISTFSTATDVQHVKGWQPFSFDIAAFDIYPYAVDGKTQANAEKYLKYWADHQALIFRKTGKQVISMLQAFSATKGASVDILSQYEWRQESSMPLLRGSFSAHVAPMHSVLSEIDIKIQEGIRDLNRKLGWNEGVSENADYLQCEIGLVDLHLPFSNVWPYNLGVILDELGNQMICRSTFLNRILGCSISYIENGERVRCIMCLGLSSDIPHMKYENDEGKNCPEVFLTQQR